MRSSWSPFVSLAALALAAACSKPSSTASPSVVSADDGEGANGSAIGRAIQDAFAAGDYRTETLLDDHGAKQTMLVVDKLRLHLSATCVAPDKKVACAAFDGLRAIAGKKVTPGPGTPASYYCAPVGATYHRWIVDEGGEDGICVFPDGSAASDWSFVYVPQIVLGQH